MRIVDLILYKHEKEEMTGNAIRNGTGWEKFHQLGCWGRALPTRECNCPKWTTIPDGWRASWEIFYMADEARSYVKSLS